MPGKAAASSFFLFKGSRHVQSGFRTQTYGPWQTPSPRAKRFFPFPSPCAPAHDGHPVMCASASFPYVLISRLCPSVSKICERGPFSPEIQSTPRFEYPRKLADACTPSEMQKIFRPRKSRRAHGVGGGGGGGISRNRPFTGPSSFSRASRKPHVFFWPQSPRYRFPPEITPAGIHRQEGSLPLRPAPACRKPQATEGCATTR